MVLAFFFAVDRLLVMNIGMHVELYQYGFSQHKHCFNKYGFTAQKGFEFLAVKGHDYQQECGL
jgi:hypothetical protein